MWQWWCIQVLLAIHLNNFYLKRDLQLCRIKKSRELIYSMTTIVNNLIIVNHLLHRELHFYYILLTTDFLTIFTDPNNALEIFLNFQGNCTTFKFSHRGRPFKTAVFNKETTLSIWGICFECRPVLTFYIHSLVLINILSRSSVAAYFNEILFVVSTDFRKPYCALDYRVFQKKSSK